MDKKFSVSDCYNLTSKVQAERQAEFQRMSEMKEKQFEESSKVTIPLHPDFNANLDGASILNAAIDDPIKAYYRGRPVSTVISELLHSIDPSPGREGLKETPDRVSKAWAFWTKGYDEHPEEILKVFEDGAASYDEMVSVCNIPVYSHCEHHLAPIFGVATVAYIPDGRIVGLSKLSRLVDCFARRLQVQERLTTQIANALHVHLKPKGVGVWISARHMCMESRGICQQGHHTVTTALRGVIKEDSRARAEFLALTR